VSTQEPTTEAGKRLHILAWEWPGDDETVDGHSNDPTDCPSCAIVAAIESAARAEGIEQGARDERRRLRSRFGEMESSTVLGPTWYAVIEVLLADPEPRARRMREYHRSHERRDFP
jgi:hypothetical protein